MWEEAPVIGNHWLLAGCVNLVILMAVLVAVVRRRFGDRVDLANRILPAARLCLLGFYALAAFSKIGRAHVCTPATNAHLVCRLLLLKNIHQLSHDSLCTF